MFNQLNHVQESTSIPLIIVDGKRIESHDHDQQLNKLADSFLTKPISTQLLLAQTHAMLRMKKAEDQLRLNRLRIEGLLRISQYHAESLQDFLDYALNEAVQLTSSQFGYIYHYDEKNGNLRSTRGQKV